MKRLSKEWNFTVSPGPGTRLPSGGIYPAYGHIGHWEVTAKVAEEMGFSAPGSNILCDAAQDPDFYDFGTVAAHAQTPDEADLCGPDSVMRTAIIDKAIDDYVGWVGAQPVPCGTVRLGALGARQRTRRSKRLSRCSWIGEPPHCCPAGTKTSRVLQRHQAIYPGAGNQETMEGVALNMRTPYFYPVSTRPQLFLTGKNRSVPFSHDTTCCDKISLTFKTIFLILSSCKSKFLSVRMSRSEFFPQFALWHIPTTIHNELYD